MTFRLEERASKNETIEYLLLLEVRRRSCLHKWKKLQKMVKQWQGAWRDKALFDNEDNVLKLPYKLSSHTFKNTIHALLSLRNHKVKYLDTKRFGKFTTGAHSHSSAYYSLLANIINLPAYEADIASSPENPNKVLGISAKQLLHLTGGKANILSEIYPVPADPIMKDCLLPGPIDCEIYHFLLIKPGKVLLTIENGSGFIKYFFDDVSGTVRTAEDKRTMFSYSHSKDAKLLKKWRIREISAIYKKTVVDLKTGLEIFFSTGKSLLLNFREEDKRELFINKLLKLREKQYKGKADIIYDGIKSIERLKIVENWREGNLSNLDYLLHLNNLASRSFNNSSQYPVMPWVVVDLESSEISINNEKIYRDLTKTVGMMGDEARAISFKNKFMQTDMTGFGHFNYGSHYSNPGIILQYMMRMHPFFEGYVQFFTGYDDPNRMFYSIQESFRSVSKDPSDVRELIPEFYSLPDIFLNTEGYNFGIRADDSERIHHAVLPPWANKSYYTFVSFLRRALEARFTSVKLNRWIDLIFGYQQRGKEAEKAFNVYPPLTTEPAKALLTYEKDIRGELRMQAFHWGQTPQQLFTKPHPDNHGLSAMSRYNAFCDEGGNIKVYARGSHAGTELKMVGSILTGSKSFSINSSAGPGNVKDLTQEIIDHGQIIAVRTIADSPSGIRYYYVTFAGNLVEGTAEISELTSKHGTLLMQVASNKIYTNNSVTNCELCLLDQTITHNYPIVILYKKGIEQIVQGGYINGSIRITGLSKGETETILIHHRTTVTCIKVDQDEKMAITGSKCGEVILYSINDAAIWTQKTILYDHGNSITHVDINDDMQLFITTSLDGSANMYSKSFRPKLIRTFRHPSGLPLRHVLFI